MIQIQMYSGGSKSDSAQNSEVCVHKQCLFSALPLSRQIVLQNIGISHLEFSFF